MELSNLGHDTIAGLIAGIIERNSSQNNEVRTINGKEIPSTAFTESKYFLTF